MAQFFGIAIGQEKCRPGIRVCVRSDGDAVWMHGKWLELADEHGVVFVDGKVEFKRADGRVFLPGSFPAWVVRGTGKRRAQAYMLNLLQFDGGAIILTDRAGRRTRLPVNLRKASSADGQE